uniref:Uncharacterized protein n=1 Tax=Mimivirus LCMiAC01 TaxID=2506608 RepID=A0A481YYV2_9VIRU|nr:MAG: hypothetical protein LCMiAC01_00320 [Mimivirus LCMiAC01]
MEKFLKIENYETTEEAIQAVASIYADKDKTMVVNNLQVNGKIINNLEVEGKIIAKTGKIGQWEIRTNRIGIPKIADMQLISDKWIRLREYNGPQYTSTGGFAGTNLWSSKKGVF